MTDIRQRIGQTIARPLIFFAVLGAAGLGLHGTAQAQGAADYTLPQPLPPCLAFKGSDEAIKSDCERLILSDSTPDGVVKVARFQRAMIVYKADRAKLRDALNAIDISDAPISIRGVLSVSRGEVCYGLKEYECTRKNYETGFLAGKLNPAGLQAFALSITETNKGDTYLKYLDDAIEREQVNTAALKPFSQNAAFVQAAILNNLGRKPERLTKLRTLAGEKIYDPLIANAVCWAMVTEYNKAFEAQSACNAAVRLAPNASGLIDSRAVMYFALGDYDSSIADFERALALEPTPSFPTFKYGLSLALDKRGKGDDKTRAATLKAEALAEQPNLEADFAKYTIYEGKP